MIEIIDRDPATFVEKLTTILSNVANYSVTTDYKMQVVFKPNKTSGSAKWINVFLCRKPTGTVFASVKLKSKQITPELYSKLDHVIHTHSLIGTTFQINLSQTEFESMVDLAWICNGAWTQVETNRIANGN